ncbi:unnamed protein product [Amoebophrya sp. A120]|nr:unnamed protein product [Amoebophrya sp. A120]|eukprot:GSA120T00004315001.1
MSMLKMTIQQILLLLLQQGWLLVVGPPMVLVAAQQLDFMAPRDRQRAYHQARARMKRAEKEERRRLARERAAQNGEDYVEEEEPGPAFPMLTSFLDSLLQPPHLQILDDDEDGDSLLQRAAEVDNNGELIASVSGRAAKKGADTDVTSSNAENDAADRERGRPGASRATHHGRSRGKPVEAPSAFADINGRQDDHVANVGGKAQRATTRTAAPRTNDGPAAKTSGGHAGRAGQASFSAEQSGPAGRKSSEQVGEEQKNESPLAKFRRMAQSLLQADETASHDLAGASSRDQHRTSTRRHKNHDKVINATSTSAPAPGSADSFPTSSDGFGSAGELGASPPRANNRAEGKMLQTRASSSSGSTSRRGARNQRTRRDVMTGEVHHGSVAEGKAKASHRLPPPSKIKAWSFLGRRFGRDKAKSREARTTDTTVTAPSESDAAVVVMIDIDENMIGEDLMAEYVEISKKIMQIAISHLTPVNLLGDPLDDGGALAGTISGSTHTPTPAPSNVDKVMNGLDRLTSGGVLMGQSIFRLLHQNNLELELPSVHEIEELKPTVRAVLSLQAAPGAGQDSYPCERLIKWRATASPEDTDDLPTAFAVFAVKRIKKFISPGADKIPLLVAVADRSKTFDDLKVEEKQAIGHAFEEACTAKIHSIVSEVEGSVPPPEDVEINLKQVQSQLRMKRDLFWFCSPLQHEHDPTTGASTRVRDTEDYDALLYRSISRNSWRNFLDAVKNNNVLALENTEAEDTYSADADALLPLFQTEPCRTGKESNEEVLKNTKVKSENVKNFLMYMMTTLKQHMAQEPTPRSSPIHADICQNRIGWWTPFADPAMLVRDYKTAKDDPLSHRRAHDMFQKYHRSVALLVDQALAALADVDEIRQSAAEAELQAWTKFALKAFTSPVLNSNQIPGYEDSQDATPATSFTEAGRRDKSGAHRHERTGAGQEEHLNSEAAGAGSGGETLPTVSAGMTKLLGKKNVCTHHLDEHQHCTPQDKTYFDAAFIGCFQDQKSEVQTSVLFHPEEPGEKFSVQKCAYQCGHFRYFGIRNGHECFCHDDHWTFADKLGVLTDDSCSHPCAAGSWGQGKKLFCGGGGDKLSMYTRDLVRPTFWQCERVEKRNRNYYEAYSPPTPAAADSQQATTESTNEEEFLMKEMTTCILNGDCWDTPLRACYTIGQGGGLFSTEKAVPESWEVVSPRANKLKWFQEEVSNEHTTVDDPANVVTRVVLDAVEKWAKFGKCESSSVVDDPPVLNFPGREGKAPEALHANYDEEDKQDRRMNAADCARLAEDDGTYNYFAVHPASGCCLFFSFEKPPREIDDEKAKNHWAATWTLYQHIEGSALAARNHDSARFALRGLQARMSDRVQWRKYIGCFKDKNGDERAMEKPIGRKYTIDECGTACKGYRYFAIQDHNECWCSDRQRKAGFGKHGHAEEKECQKECHENHFDVNICGGGWHNSVFEHMYTERQEYDMSAVSTGGLAPSLSAVGYLPVAEQTRRALELSMVDRENDFEYVGCYEALRGNEGLTEGHADRSVYECADHCGREDRMYEYFSIDASKECICHQKHGIGTTSSTISQMYDAEDRVSDQKCWGNCKFGDASTEHHNDRPVSPNQNPPPLVNRKRVVGFGHCGGQTGSPHSGTQRKFHALYRFYSAEEAGGGAAATAHLPQGAGELSAEKTPEICLDTGWSGAAEEVQRLQGPAGEEAGAQEAGQQRPELSKVYVTNLDTAVQALLVSPLFDKNTEQLRQHRSIIGRREVLLHQVFVLRLAAFRLLELIKWFGFQLLADGEESPAYFKTALDLAEQRVAEVLERDFFQAPALDFDEKDHSGEARADTEDYASDQQVCSGKKLQSDLSGEMDFAERKIGELPSLQYGSPGPSAAMATSSFTERTGRRAHSTREREDFSALEHNLARGQRAAQSTSSTSSGDGAGQNGDMDQLEVEAMQQLQEIRKDNAEERFQTLEGEWLQLLQVFRDQEDELLELYLKTVARLTQPVLVSEDIVDLSRVTGQLLSEALAVGVHLEKFARAGRAAEQVPKHMLLPTELYADLEKEELDAAHLKDLLTKLQISDVAPLWQPYSDLARQEFTNTLCSRCTQLHIKHETSCDKAAVFPGGADPSISQDVVEAEHGEISSDTPRTHVLWRHESVCSDAKAWDYYGLFSTSVKSVSEIQYGVRYKCGINGDHITVNQPDLRTPQMVTHIGVDRKLHEGTDTMEIKYYHCGDQARLGQSVATTQAFALTSGAGGGIQKGCVRQTNMKHSGYENHGVGSRFVQDVRTYEECLNLCVETEACNGFTFARTKIVHDANPLSVAVSRTAAEKFCTRIENVEYVGTDVHGNMDGLVTFEQCWAACKAHDKCVGFVYGKHVPDDATVLTSNCILKSDMGDPDPDFQYHIYDFDSVFLKREDGSICDAPPVPTCRRLEDVTYLAGEFKDFKSPEEPTGKLTFEECWTACANNSDCKGFTHRKDGTATAGNDESCALFLTDEAVATEKARKDNCCDSVVLDRVAGGGLVEQDEETCFPPVPVTRHVLPWSRDVTDTCVRLKNIKFPVDGTGVFAVVADLPFEKCWLLCLQETDCKGFTYNKNAAQKEDAAAANDPNCFLRSTMNPETATISEPSFDSVVMERESEQQESSFESCKEKVKREQAECGRLKRQKVRLMRPDPSQRQTETKAVTADTFQDCYTQCFDSPDCRGFYFEKAATGNNINCHLQNRQENAVSSLTVEVEYNLHWDSAILIDKTEDACKSSVKRKVGKNRGGAPRPPDEFLPTCFIHDQPNFFALKPNHGTDAVEMTPECRRSKQTQCEGCGNRPNECWGTCGGGGDYAPGWCNKCDSNDGTRSGACCRAFRDTDLADNKMQPPECRQEYNPLLQTQFKPHARDYDQCVLPHIRNFGYTSLGRGWCQCGGQTCAGEKQFLLARSGNTRKSCSELCNNDGRCKAFVQTTSSEGTEVEMDRCTLFRPENNADVDGVAEEKEPPAAKAAPSTASPSSFLEDYHCMRKIEVGSDIGPPKLPELVTGEKNQPSNQYRVALLGEKCHGRACAKLQESKCDGCFQTADSSATITVTVSLADGSSREEQWDWTWRHDGDCFVTCGDKTGWCNKCDSRDGTRSGACCNVSKVGHTSEACTHTSWPNDFPLRFKGTRTNTTEAASGTAGPETSLVRSDFIGDSVVPEEIAKHAECVFPGAQVGRSVKLHESKCDGCIAETFGKVSTAEDNAVPGDETWFWRHQNDCFVTCDRQTGWCDKCDSFDGQRKGACCHPSGAQGNGVGCPTGSVDANSALFPMRYDLAIHKKGGAAGGTQHDETILQGDAILGLPVAHRDALLKHVGHECMFPQDDAQSTDAPESSEHVAPWYSPEYVSQADPGWCNCEKSDGSKEACSSSQFVPYSHDATVDSTPFGSFWFCADLCSADLHCTAYMLMRETDPTGANALADSNCILFRKEAPEDDTKEKNAHLKDAWQKDLAPAGFETRCYHKQPTTCASFKSPSVCNSDGVTARFGLARRCVWTSIENPNEKAMVETCFDCDEKSVILPGDATEATEWQVRQCEFASGLKCRMDKSTGHCLPVVSPAVSAHGAGGGGAGETTMQSSSVHQAQARPELGATSVSAGKQEKENTNHAPATSSPEDPSCPSCPT